MEVTGDRQGFLGPRMPIAMQRSIIGIVGVSGGGSHVAQQTAHLGFMNYAIFDQDRIDESNLHRLVGAQTADVKERRLKVEVARRTILGVRPAARVRTIDRRWQDDPAALRACDLVFGCIDSFRGRAELEVACRRYQIPYIDIGMDVIQQGDSPPRMVGQVALSMPAESCLFCFGVLTDTLLAKEASQYGDAGFHPQVVWANGVLASAAVGMAVDLLTAWSGEPPPPLLVFDGNAGTLSPSSRLQFIVPGGCVKCRSLAVGDPTPFIT